MIKNGDIVICIRPIPKFGILLDNKYKLFEDVSSYLPGLYISAGVGISSYRLRLMDTENGLTGWGEYFKYSPRIINIPKEEI